MERTGEVEFTNFTYEIGEYNPEDRIYVYVKKGSKVLAKVEMLDEGINWVEKSMFLSTKEKNLIELFIENNRVEFLGIFYS